LEAKRAWKEAEKDMDEEPVYVNFGINGVFYTKAMVDTGCLCYGTITVAKPSFNAYASHASPLPLETLSRSRPSSRKRSLM
jgi:hypothetical protein